MAEAEEVPETNQSQAAGFSFVVSLFADPGEDITLPVHLSPETSAVSMNISWYRGTELIYQYKNELESINTEYESRVSLSIQELKTGNLSLTLRNVQQSDSGKYTCQVYHDRCLKTVRVDLQVRGERQLQRQIMEQQRQIKELELDKQIKNLEMDKRIMKLEMEKQINELELDKQIMKLKMERQIMEMERRIEDLEKPIHELRLYASHGPQPRRRGNSFDGVPPRMSDDTPETHETEERETRDTMERESGDQNTGEESTVTEQETPGTSSQVLQSTSESVISSTRVTQTQENPGTTMQTTQEGERVSTEQERSSTDRQSQEQEETPSQSGDTTQTPERPEDRTQ